MKYIYSIKHHDVEVERMVVDAETKELADKSISHVIEKYDEMGHKVTAEYVTEAHILPEGRM